MKRYSRLSFKERVRIETHFREGLSLAAIGRKLVRSKSTISRELARAEEYSENYCAELGEGRSFYQSQLRARPRKLENMKLLNEVLSGLRRRWSPEQVSKNLDQKYPDEPEMQISHESIYTYIYVLPRGELRRELVSYLRQKKKTRYKRIGSRDNRGKIPEMVSIEERPKEVEDRSLPGHWEGDLIVGRLGGSALGTLVERKTRAVIMVPVRNRKPSHVRKAFERALKNLPEEMKSSLTYDHGKEMNEHRLFTRNTKMKVYFCHPASPWERGTCENTNGLIRDYFPKGTDFSKIPRREIKRVQRELNERPRKTLGFLTPMDVFAEEVLNTFR